LLSEESFIWEARVASCEARWLPLLRGPVPIERIRAGDQVYTVDLDEGKLRNNKVLKTFKSGRTEIIELGLGDETIACTPQHRFYREGWVAATELKPGDRLSSREGQRVELKAVRRISKLQFVYNFTVEGPHNYLVGKSELLVHNRKRKEEDREPDDDKDP
jgi:intein/homing endonuclease